MLDGIYQSVMCYYMGHLIFAPATFETSNGLNINDRPRIGVYIACATIVVVNTYVLMNMYRWDWLFLLLVAISILLIWFWTGIYTAFSSSLRFYKAAPQVYGQLSFWAMDLTHNGRMPAATLRSQSVSEALSATGHRYYPRAGSTREVQTPRAV